MIDTLTFDTCLNLFATVDDLLTFLIKEQPAEVRLVYDRYSEAYSAHAYERPEGGWTEADLVPLSEFVFTLQDGAAPA